MREHGTRAKYVFEKCRCDECRAANRAYYHQAKRRVAPAQVSAVRAREHLRDLSQAGVGYKQVAKTTGIANSTVAKIVTGKTAYIRPETERALMAVTPRAAADAGIVDATYTWEIIERLLAKGWTKAGISAAIGGNGHALQLGKTRVKGSTARAVAELWEREKSKGAPAEGKHTWVEPPAFFEGDTGWMKRGACKSPDVPTWVFFPGRGSRETLEAARAICATCAVADDCLTYALRNNAIGVWGGTTEKERRTMPKPGKLCPGCGGEIAASEDGNRHKTHCDSCQQGRRDEARRAHNRDKMARYRMGKVAS